MHRLPSLIALSIMLLVPFCVVQTASSLVPTQLEGVDGANVYVQVSSDFLPLDRESRESLKAEIEAGIADRFAKYGLNVLETGLPHLVVKVSGQTLDLKTCGDFVFLEIEVEYSEPVILSRDPAIRFSRPAVIWRSDSPNIVPEVELEDWILRSTNSLINDFCRSVESANTAGE